jgi:hypothetical protein
MRHANNSRARGVSAAMIVRDISPWTIGQEHPRRQMFLFHHPHARLALPVGTIWVAERWSSDGQQKERRGHDVRHFLSLPPNRPEVTR